MARDFQIFGPALVAVQFGEHVPVAPALISGAAQSGSTFIPTRFSNLGLAVDQINVQLNFRHQDIKTDAYGSEIPIDSQFLLADAIINTRLVHWDADILELCLREATGGGSDPTSPTQPAGTLAYAGTIMGGGCPQAVAGVPFVPGSGYHYVSLNILPSPALTGSRPWRFPAAYLTGRPVVLPLGTEKSIADCTWRAIPYGINTNQLDIVVSGVGTSLNTGGGTGGGYLSIHTVISSPDAVSLDIGVDNPVFLWDHTQDQPDIV